MLVHMHDLLLTLPFDTAFNFWQQAQIEAFNDQLSSADTEDFSDMPDLIEDTEWTGDQHITLPLTERAPIAIQPVLTFLSSDLH